MAAKLLKNISSIFMNLCDLQLIYEYSLRIPLPLDSLQGNFTRSILPLSHILNQTLPEDDDEQSKIMLYHSVENFFSGGEQHLPSIQFCNVSNTFVRKNASLGFNALFELTVINQMFVCFFARQQTEMQHP